MKTGRGTKVHLWNVDARELGGRGEGGGRRLGWEGGGDIVIGGTRRSFVMAIFWRLGDAGRRQLPAPLWDQKLRRNADHSRRLAMCPPPILSLTR